MKSANATYTGFEFNMDGYPGMAIINIDLKKADNRFQYNYAVFVDIVPDRYNENGFPVEEEYDYLNDIEKKMIAYLEEQTRTIHVGHTTIYRKREVIFYTKDPEAVQDFLDHYLQTI